jgi:hypothetical protein
MTLRRGLWGLVALLVGVGVGLLVLSAFTPVYTDPVGYERAQDAVREAYNSGAMGHEAATTQFFAVLDRFETRKWIWLDAGASALAWAGLVALALIATRFAGGQMTTRRFVVVLPVTALALGALFVGLVMTAFLPFDRVQLPEWSDTLAIPIMSAVSLVMLLTPIIGLYVIPPLFRRRAAPAGLLRPGRGWTATVLTTLIYLPPLALALFLLVGALDPGGWVLTVAAGLLIWLLLNARALWLAPALSMKNGSD